nr:MAG TPA: hypothetical protein [Caudoviricetes sp.]
MFVQITTTFGTKCSNIRGKTVQHYGQNDTALGTKSSNYTVTKIAAPIHIGAAFPPVASGIL